MFQANNKKERKKKRKNNFKNPVLYAFSRKLGN